MGSNLHSLRRGSEHAIHPPAVDRGSFPADQVLNHFEGSFAFVLFDSSSKTLMVSSDIEGKCSLFWGCTSDGSLAFSDDDEVLKNGCGTSFAPIPVGCYFSSMKGRPIKSPIITQSKQIQRHSA